MNLNYPIDCILSPLVSDALLEIARNNLTDVNNVVNGLMRQHLDELQIDINDFHQRLVEGYDPDVVLSVCGYKQADLCTVLIIDQPQFMFLILSEDEAEQFKNDLSNKRETISIGDWFNVGVKHD